MKSVLCGFVIALALTSVAHAQSQTCRSAERRQIVALIESRAVDYITEQRVRTARWRFQPVVQLWNDLDRLALDMQQAVREQNQRALQESMVAFMRRQKEFSTSFSDAYGGIGAIVNPGMLLLGPLERTRSLDEFPVTCRFLSGGRPSWIDGRCPGSSRERIDRFVNRNVVRQPFPNVCSMFWSVVTP